MHELDDSELYEELARDSKKVQDILNSEKLVMASGCEKTVAIKAITDIYEVPNMMPVVSSDILYCITNAEHMYMGTSRIFTGNMRAVEAAKDALSKIDGMYRPENIAAIICSIECDDTLALYEVNDVDAFLCESFKDQVTSMSVAIVMGYTIRNAMVGARVTLLVADSTKKI